MSLVNALRILVIVIFIGLGVFTAFGLMWDTTDTGSKKILNIMQLLICVFTVCITIAHWRYGK